MKKPINLFSFIPSKCEEDNFPEHHVAQVLRSRRKSFGFSQIQVASQIHVSQSTLSKIESGMLKPDVFQWYGICQQLKLSPTGWVRGVIDSGQAVTLKSEPKEGLYNIPGYYAYNRGESNRYYLPFFYIFKEALGEKSLYNFLETLKIDLDYFLDFDNQLNFNFFMSLVNALIDQGVLKSHNIEKLLECLTLPYFHGSSGESFLHQAGNWKRLLKEALRQRKRYEIDFIHTLEDESEEQRTISVKPNDHLRDFQYRHKKWGSFLCDFHKSWYKNVLAFEGKTSVTIQEKACHFKGADRCIYTMTA